MRVSGLVPARFLTIVAHLVIVIVIFGSKGENIKMSLPVRYTSSDFHAKDLQITTALSLTLALLVLELVGFMGGVTMFLPVQGLLSTAAHAAAAVALSYFLFDSWPCDWYWYIFTFCSVLPAITECGTMLGVLCFKKGV